MCSKGGGSPPVPSAASTTFNSTVQPSPAVSPLYTDFLNRANALSNTPFNPAQLGQVAPLNASQTAAGNQLFNVGMNTTDITNAADYLRTVGTNLGNFDPARVTAIMSPFTEQVVGATQNWFNNQNAIQGNDLLSQAIRSGNAFGGDRAGVAESVLAGQQQLAQAPVIAGLRQAGYTQALDEYNRLKQFELAGAQAGLGGELQSQQAALQGAGAALGWGSMQQAQTQKEFDVAQQNAMMQSAYPFQTLNWYGSLLGGIGPLLGQTAFGSNNPPEQSGLGAGLGAATAGIGLASSLVGGGTSGAAGTPTGPAGFRRGGMVLQRRAQGGLVPVFIRHNGGLVPGLAYGGDTSGDYEEESRTDREDSEARESKQRDYSDYSNYDLPPPPRRATRSDLGLDPAMIRSQPLPFPGFPGGTGATGQPQKSELQSGIEGVTGLVKAAAPLIPLFMASDPKLKTDVERMGKTDDGEPLYGFRYRGDPKWYPKVVGPMAVPQRRQGGGDVLSDEAEDPLVAGQQYARDASGRATWFNPKNEVGGWTYTDPSGQGWTDWGAKRNREGPHAGGLPSTVRGFASPGREDLNNWFEVNVGGRKAYAQKTDIGPPGVIDLNAPLASSMGFNPGNVSGRASVRDLGRNRPPEAAYAQASQADADAAAPKRELPLFTSPEARQPGPEERQPPPQGQGRASPDPSAGPADARVGTGAVGTRIPGAPRQPETFAQRLAQNPFWQFGTALMAKPGIKGRELSAIGSAAQVMSAQQLKERERVLDDKPKLTDVGGMMHWQTSDGQLIPTGMKSTAGMQEARAERESRENKPFAVKREVRGPFGSTSTVEDYYIYDKNGNMVPFTGVAGAAEQPETPRVLPPDVKPPAQQTPPQQPPSTAPQVRQTEAQPTPAVPAGPTGWSQDPNTGNWRDKEGATYDSTGKPLAPAPAKPTQTAQPPAQQQQQPQQDVAAGPVEDTLGLGTVGIAPVGAVMNPNAMAGRRNESAIANLTPDEQRIVKGIADYKIDPNKYFAGAGKQAQEKRQNALAKVAEYDPEYDQKNYATQAQAYKEFGFGTSGKNLVSNRMVLEHIGDAMTATEKLGNYTFAPGITNPVTGKIAKQYNTEYQAALKEFEAAAGAASTEAAKTFRGVGSMSVQEQEAWKTIAAYEYASPVELRAALRTLAGLVAGRVNAASDSYNSVVTPDRRRDGETWLTPKAKETLQRATFDEQNRSQVPIPPSQFPFGITKPRQKQPQQGQ